MTKSVENILQQMDFSFADIVALLQAEGEDRKALFAKAAEVKEKHLGNYVYFRGLIEMSNVCAKNCLYCGIRKDNTNVERYNLKDDEIVEAAVFAWEHNYGSIVIQGGELSSNAFTERIVRLLDEIHTKTKNELRVTLSLGEQSREVYKLWNEHGAQRYLLRIESSDKELYEKIHPVDDTHSFETRLKSLKDLHELGYQTGTGVMIGLPFQNVGHLAKDLLFLKEFNIDMVGMGPYIEHADTPLFEYKDTLWSLQERFNMSLKMVAVLRILMPEINIAAATALQAIDKTGREKALKIGANVMMPNVTPGFYRDDYKLYENKPCTDEDADQCANCLEARVALASNEIAYGQSGDSLHYKNRIQNQ